MTVFVLAIGLVSVVFSFLYGFIYTHRNPSFVRTFIKAIPVSALAAISLVLVGPWTLTAALALGVVGDVFLSRSGTRNFIIGLGAFLVGHLFYVAVLIGVGQGAGVYGADVWRAVGCVALVAVAFGIVRVLLPHLGALKWPVLAYVCVIVVMGMAALGLPVSWPLRAAMIGAFMFIASDVILAFELFVFKPKAAHARRFCGFSTGVGRLQSQFRSLLCERS